MKRKLDMEHFAAVVERYTTPLLEDSVSNEEEDYEMTTKPPPDWSTTVKIPIRDVLKWHLHNDKVSWAVTAAAGLAADIPKKYEDYWMATSIEITGDYFTVHLGAWDADTRGQASPHNHLSPITNNNGSTNRYIAFRTPQGLCVLRPNSTVLPLRLDLYNHSPTGFECGYGGSGPAQLALALLADAFGDQVALAHHQDFKWKVVAALPRDEGWSLTVDQIRAALNVATPTLEPAGASV